jgi:hypothetical protein
MRKFCPSFLYEADIFRKINQIHAPVIELRGHGVVLRKANLPKPLANGFRCIFTRVTRRMW